MNRKMYLLSRFLQLATTFLIILTILFFLFRLALPDPTTALIVEGLSLEEQQIVREKFGLHLPLWQQYFVYLKNSVFGEFGTSFHYKAPVAPIVYEKFLNTMVLMTVAILISYTVGPALGVLLTWKRGGKLEIGGIVTGLVFRSAPMFWTGMLSIMFFGVYLGWFPTSGMRTLPFDSSGFLDTFFTLDFLHHLVLPALMVAIYYMGLPMLIMRNTMLEIMGEDFIELCRAKGLKERTVMYRHAARNALLPVVTQAAVTIGLAVGGQVVVEVVFSWPGLGREMLQAVRTSDYPMAQATFLLMAFMVLAMNFVADALYGVLDPRVSIPREGR